MRRMLIPAPLGTALLSARTTPQEYCILRATEELRTVDRLIADVETDIARGYTLRSESYMQRVWKVCSVSRDAQGNVTQRFYCWQSELFTRDVPEAIDPAQERRKLRALEARRDRLAAEAAPPIAACRATHPE